MTFLTSQACLRNLLPTLLFHTSTTTPTCFSYSSWIPSITTTHLQSLYRPWWWSWPTTRSTSRSTSRSWTSSSTPCILFRMHPFYCFKIFSLCLFVCSLVLLYWCIDIVRCMSGKSWRRASSSISRHHLSVIYRFRIWAVRSGCMFLMSLDSYTCVVLGRMGIWVEFQYQSWSRELLVECWMQTCWSSAKCLGWYWSYRNESSSPLMISIVEIQRWIRRRPSALSDYTVYTHYYTSVRDYFFITSYTYPPRNHPYLFRTPSSINEGIVLPLLALALEQRA